MANPNLGTTALPVKLDVLYDAQLGGGNNDAVVPTGKAWALKSTAMTNTSQTPVTVTVAVLRSGGTARRVFSRQINPGDTAVITAALLAFLPEAATLRFTASAAGVVDTVMTGAALG